MRLRYIIEFELETNPEDYPEDKRAPEDIVALEKQYFENDPVLVLQHALERRYPARFDVEIMPEEDTR